MSLSDKNCVSKENTSVVEPSNVVEDGDNTSMSSTDTLSESQNGSEVDSSQNTIEEPSVPSVTSDSNECRISIPNSVFTNTSPERFRFIRPQGLVRGILKPEDFNMRTSHSPIGRAGLGEVTTLSEFLTFAHRNNYDIVIPVSREHRSLNPTSLDPGCGYVVLDQQHFPHDYSAASYHPTEFIGLNNGPTRNSVLTPHMYPTTEDIQPPAVDFSAPPPYEMPVKLPSYEEVQREKALQGEAMPVNVDTQNPDPTSPHTLSFLAIDTDLGTNSDPQTKLLGTDFMFIVAFFLALIFNWVGFLLLMCFCHTVAARYGALSGFGLSLAKWTLIVKNSTEVPIQNVWVWWLITAFGFLICIRSLCQYYHIKRGWRLMSSAAQQRLLLFY